jgi:site-specific DNA-methyltransferase (cytosine-N4-specific)
MPDELARRCVKVGSEPGGLIFDPFIGSGTVGAVAERLGRRWVGTDLNPVYHQLATKRTAQRGLRFADDAA